MTIAMDNPAGFVTWLAGMVTILASYIVLDMKRGYVPPTPAMLVVETLFTVSSSFAAAGITALLFRYFGGHQ